MFGLIITAVGFSIIILLLTSAIISKEGMVSPRLLFICWVIILFGWGALIELWSR